MLPQGVVEIGEQRRRREAIDLLVSDIVKGNDDSVATSLRMALERGWRTSIMDVLKEAKKRKELEISKITSRHYPEFKLSVNEMLKLQPTASELLSLVTTVNRDFLGTKAYLTEIANDLNTANSEREKVRVVLEASLNCQSIVTKMVQAKENIESHSHYAAMHSLEAIQREIKSLEQIDVADRMKSLMQYLTIWMPMMTNKLLDTIRVDSQESIQTVRLDNFLVGQTLLRRCASQLIFDQRQEFVQSYAYLNLCTVNPSLSVLAIYPSCSTLRFEQWASIGEFDSIVPSNFIDNPTEEGVYLLDQDLSPRLANIYKAVHIHHKLNQKHVFDDFYRVSRETYLPHIFEDAEEIVSYQSLASVMPNLIGNIVGFFAIECSLMHGISNHHHHHIAFSNSSASELQPKSNSNRNRTKKKKSNNKRNKQVLTSSENNVFSETEVSIIWDRTISYLHAFISRHLRTISTPEQLLQIKEELLLLSELICDDLFNLRPQAIYEIIRSMWNNYERVQIQSVTSTISYLLKNCAFQPFQIPNEEIFIRKIRAYRLDTINLDPEQIGQGINSDTLNSSNNKGKQINANATLDALEADIGIQTSAQSNININSSGGSNMNDMNGNNLLNNVTSGISSRGYMGQTFPFSEVVPDILREVHGMIAKFFIFAARNPHLGSRGETLCNAIKRVYESIAIQLNRLLLADGKETPLSKACQISIDAATFAQTSDLIFQILEPMLERFRWSESINIHLPMAINVMKTKLIQISLQAQELIFELLANKIVDLLGSLVFINFTPMELGSPNLTHESIDEIIDFLKITFMWLTHLPQSARDNAHFTACSKVCSGIVSYLLSPKVSAINMFCIAIFHNDVKKLIQFANSCAIPHLKQCFQELSDLIKALLNPDLPNVVDNIQQRKSQYPKLNPLKLATLLEKLVPTSAGVAQNNLPRVDKTNMKNLAKKLRLQATTSTK